MTIKSYTTLAADNLRELDRLVNELLLQGWQPYGPQYAHDGLICQPMVHVQLKELNG